MGRYAGKITHKFSTDPTRPYFDETIRQMKILYLKQQLAKLTEEQQEYFIQNLKDEGYLS